MTEFDPGSFTLQEKGHKFEDFPVGRTFVHHWGRTIGASEALLFTTTVCNWNPMYVNAEYARGHGHDTVVVNPMLVLCTVVGMSVEDLSEAGGPFLGVEDCEFHRPTYPEDTITARSTVVAARLSAGRPDAGIVTWHTEARNQRGELVLELRRTNLVAKRGMTNVALAPTQPPP